MQPELDKFLTNKDLTSGKDEAIIALRDRAKDADRKMRDFYDEQKDQPINPKILSQYTALYTEYTKCYSEVCSTIEYVAKERIEKACVETAVSKDSSALQSHSDTVSRGVARRVARFTAAVDAPQTAFKPKSYVDYNESEPKPNPTSDIAMRSQKRQSIVSALRSKCPSTLDDEVRVLTTPHAPQAQQTRRR
ncbi:MAG: hypothetical protein V4485_04740 [Pseudomonadota bacterium]